MVNTKKIDIYSVSEYFLWIFSIYENKSFQNIYKNIYWDVFFYLYMYYSIKYIYLYNLIYIYLHSTLLKNDFTIFYQYKIMWYICKF